MGSTDNAPAYKRKLRILVLTSTYPRWQDDTEPTFVHELSRRLAKHHQVTVLAPRSRGARKYETINGVQIIRFPYWFQRQETLTGTGGGLLGRLGQNRWLTLLLPLLFISQIWHTARIIRNQTPNVIHAHWIIPQGLAALLARTLARRSVPVLCTAHGADLYGLRGALWKRAKAFVLRRVEAITVVSHAMETDLRGSFQQSLPATTPIHVAPMGVDLRVRFTPASSKETETKSAGPRLLFVGRLVQKKGLDILLRALPGLIHRYPNITLDVVGSGPDELDAKRLVAQLGLTKHVHFHGMVGQNRLPAFYRRATLLVAPFRVARSGDQEGLGLVPVEALGCGCPVIASDLPAVRDVLHNDPLARVPPEDPTALAVRITDLLNDPARLSRMVDSDRNHCFERFDWQSVTKRYDQLLGSLCTWQKQSYSHSYKSSL